MTGSDRLHLVPGLRDAGKIVAGVMDGRGCCIISDCKDRESPRTTPGRGARRALALSVPMQNALQQPAEPHRLAVRCRRLGRLLLQGPRARKRS